MRSMCASRSGIDPARRCSAASIEAAEPRRSTNSVVDRSAWYSAVRARTSTRSARGLLPPAVGVPVRKFGDAPELADRAGVGQEIEVGSDENPNDLLEARSLGEALARTAD